MNRLPRCEKGTRRNPRTKLCEPVTAPTVTALTVSAPTVSAPMEPIHITKNTRKRCPAGFRRDKVTGECVSTKPATRIQPQEEPLMIPEPMSTKQPISFLFLTYGAIVHETAIRKLTDKHRVYIHPKFPKLVQPHFRKHIIPELIDDTEWGSIRIVDATVSLLRAALFDDPNDSKKSQWFVLLSQDVFPVVSEPELSDFLATQTMSMFHVRGLPLSSANKASQWWILNRTDATLIVKRYDQYRQIFVSEKRRSEEGAPDELFFLGCLRYARDIPHARDYQYVNRVSVYNQWLTHTIQKSPATFRRLTEPDLRHVQSLGALFVRKTFGDYDVNPVPKRTTVSRTLVVVYVGTKSRQEYGKLCRMVDDGKVDVIVLSAIPVPEINVELVRRCLCVHSIIWRFVVESMMNLTVVSCTTWDRMVLLSESFRSDDLEECRLNDTKLVPIHPVGVKRGFSYPLPFEPKYVHVVDGSRESAWVFSNTIGGFVAGESVLL